MRTLIVNQSEVARLLPLDKCMGVMADALKALATGSALNPLRTKLSLLDGSGLLSMMPGYLGAATAALGVKVITVFPGNWGTPYDLHQGAVLLFETQHGRLQAIMDATAITSIRTAAVSGVATRLLARDDAHDLAVLGSGVQATAHLAAMLLVRKIRRIRVWSVPHDHAVQFAARESRKHSISIEVMESAQKAVDGADLICTCTSTTEPVLFGRWIAPGAHINAMGSSIPTTRELDTEAVVKSRLFVDRRESTINEAGDFLFPKHEGAITDAHIRGEIGEILAGRLPGRTSAAEVTLFKSLGLGIEDVASARYIYDRAVEQGLGTEVELGGSRDGAT